MRAKDTLRKLREEKGGLSPLTGEPAEEIS
jgi:hypothetical protein